MNAIKTVRIPIEWPRCLILAMALSCQSPTKTETARSVPTSTENTEARADTIPTLTSRFRPGESLSLDEVYTDTVQFVGVNDDGDYFLFNVRKAQDTVWLLYGGAYDFVRGDRLAIQWKIDSIRPAGDPGFLDYTEALVSATLVEPMTLQDRSTRFLWREKRFLEAYDATVSTIVLDTAYAGTLTDPEKAALGYVATFIGNECAWDGKATPTRSNLKCKILTALNLGYQCSGTHLGFLRHWFRGDSTALKKLENCPTIPDGATAQETFDHIDVTVAGNEIIVAYAVTGINTQRGKSWTWSAKDYFSFRDNRLRLMKTEKSEPVVGDIEISGD